MPSMMYNEGVQTNFTFMPRKSSSTATPATPRKTRTRKTTTSRRKSASKINTSTAKIKVAEVKEAPKVEVAKVDTPVKVRPSQPNLKVEDYLSDFKVRWQIHQFETQQLWDDIVKGYNFTVPYVQKSVTYVKDSYNRAFN